MGFGGILVIDDDDALVDLIVDRLAQSGYQATSAPDAMQGVLQAEGIRPKLIITDIMMPIWGSGADAYREIRRSRALRDVPVIFLTGMVPAQARRVVPANDRKVRLLFKPVDWPLLEQAIRELTGEGKPL